MSYSTYDKTIVFDEIAGISPYNVRHDDHEASGRAGAERAGEDRGDDLTSLKASIRARGLIYRPLVHFDDEARAYFVIEGGRRWRARREIMIEDRHDADLTPFDVTVVSGATPDELIALSATGNVLTRPMHPVREYEAFAAIAAALPNEEAALEAIAKEFGLTRRQVKQRLALGSLSATIRAAWLSGAIEADAAKAYAECPDIAAQDAFFATAPDDRRATPASIRKALLGDQIDANDPLMRFLGEDAYRAAGGEIRDSLFAEERRFSGALARKLADEKLRVEAERIRAAEGWGFCMVPGDPGEDECEEAYYEPDYLPDEEKTLDAWRAELRDLAPTSPRALALALGADAIEGKATMRAIPADERRALGVFVDHDAWGALIVTRALERPEQGDAPVEEDGDEEGHVVIARGSATKQSTPDSSSGRRTPEREAENEPIGKQLRTVLDETLAGALHAATARSVNLALTIAVARLGCAAWSGSHIELRLHARRGWSPAHPLLRAIERDDFADALAKVAAATLADITTAFCELVGAAIDPSRMDKLEPSLGLLTAAAGLTAIEADLKEHFDPDSYFRAATKDAAIAMIRETEGEAAAAEARGFKKPALIERATLIAKDFAWLPPVLRAPLEKAGANETPALPACVADSAQTADEKAPDTRTLAQAMADALDSDDALSPEPTETATPAASHEAEPPLFPLATHVRTFIDAACEIREDQDVKASAFLAAYNAWATHHSLPQATQAGLAIALHECGFRKHRFADGVFYLGLGLIEAETTEAAQ